jgi:hypothetical protein
MHGVNRRITKEFAVITCRFGDGEACSQARACIRVPTENRGSFHRLNPLHRFEVDATHKSSSEDCCSDWFHPEFLSFDVC